MTWDDELEDLAERAFIAFGDAALGKAFVRALSAAPALEQVPQTFARLRQHHRALKLIDATTSVQYFKNELRLMLKAH